MEDITKSVTNAKRGSGISQEIAKNSLTQKQCLLATATVYLHRLLKIEQFGKPM
jgi:hypothetical protein